MCKLSTHRGPDDEGIYLDGNVGLGIRRLSIIDVAGGHQPLSNEDGIMWIVFNGEIYNHTQLRTWLEAKGHNFSTQSDTEVIIHLYEELGDGCVTELNGMFAFAIWDGRKRKLLLARDRLGQKPLHYALTQEGLIFASEIPPILENADVERRLNMMALRQYLRLWYVPGPLTMFEGIQKLPPAHILICEGGKVNIKRYWDVDFSQKLDLSEREWSDQILDLLEDSVRIRLMSEVPLGAMLSGGIDSSSVVALMSSISNKSIKTFSIGFDDKDYNELPHARQVAQHLGTDHYEDIVQPDATKVLPELVWHYGEPFGDESCIPTYYVSRLTSQYVTVALSGDGGDEAFGGYPRLANYLTFKPFNSLRGLIMGQLKSSVNPQNRPMNSVASRRGFRKELIFRINEILDPIERYTHEWLVWDDGVEGLLTPDCIGSTSNNRAMTGFDQLWQHSKGWNSFDRLLYLELMTYLPDDLQVKIDIASMAVSLEVRAPFLDYRLVELAASMPANLKYHNGNTKYLLREIVNKMLPAEITNRGKQGFSMPIGTWLRNELRPMVEDTLLAPTSLNRGIFKPDIVKDMVDSHLAGDFDYSRHIWLLLNFELWYRIFINS